MTHIPGEEDLRHLDLGQDEVSPERENCKGCFYLISDDCGQGLGPFQSEPNCWEPE